MTMPPTLKIESRDQVSEDAVNSPDDGQVVQTPGARRRRQGTRVTQYQTRLSRQRPTRSRARPCARSAVAQLKGKGTVAADSTVASPKRSSPGSSTRTAVRLKWHASKRLRGPPRHARGGRVGDPLARDDEVTEAIYDCLIRRGLRPLTSRLLVKHAVSQSSTAYSRIAWFSVLRDPWRELRQVSCQQRLPGDVVRLLWDAEPVLSGRKPRPEGPVAKSTLPRGLTSPEEEEMFDMARTGRSSQRAWRSRHTHAQPASRTRSAEPSASGALLTSRA